MQQVAAAHLCVYTKLRDLTSHSDLIVSGLTAIGHACLAPLSEGASHAQLQTRRLCAPYETLLRILFSVAYRNTEGDAENRTLNEV
jgi:hypothetical protein